MENEGGVQWWMFSDEDKVEGSFRWWMFGSEDEVEGGIYRNNVRCLKLTI